jgi:hypothetical protein
MDELHDAAEAQSEEQRARDRQQRRAKFVCPPFIKHTMQEAGRGR